MIMTSLDWVRGCSDSRTPEEHSRPTPLKHLRLENLDVGPTATDIAIEVATNVFSGRLGMRLQERFAGQQQVLSTC